MTWLLIGLLLLIAAVCLTVALVADEADLGEAPSHRALFDDDGHRRHVPTFDRKK